MGYTLSCAGARMAPAWIERHLRAFSFFPLRTQPPAANGGAEREMHSIRGARRFERRGVFYAQ